MKIVEVVMFFELIRIFLNLDSRIFKMLSLFNNLLNFSLKIMIIIELIMFKILLWFKSLFKNVLLVLILNFL